MSTRTIPPAAYPAPRPLGRPPAAEKILATLDPALAALGSEKPLPLLVRVLLGVFIILIYSRAVELIPVPGLILGLGSGLILYGAVSGRLLKTRMQGSTFLLLAFTVWMVPSGVFGIWRGGSAQLMIQVWSRSLLVYFVLIALVHHVRSIRSVILMIALADVTIALLSFQLSTDQLGRLVLTISTLSNPNDLATFLLVGLPCCLFVAGDSSRNIALRILVALASVRIVWMLFRTGSRGGLVAFGIVILFMVIFMKGAKRRLLVAALVIGALAAPLILPGHITSRYMTLFSDDVDYNEPDRMLEFAQGSQAMRWHVFLASLSMTMRNPIFGVGPGNTAVAYAAETKVDRRRGIYLQSHNAFTQVSAETGIVGALLFIGAIAYAFRAVNRIRRHVRVTPELRQYEGMGLCLLASLTAWIGCAMSSSIAYYLLLPLLLGLAVAMEHAFRDVARHSEVVRRPTARARA